MDTIAVAAPVAPAAPEAAPQRAPSQDGTGAKPFEQALKQELARPQDKGGEASQAPQPEAQAAKAAPAAKPDPQALADVAIAMPEWAALLESAGLAEKDDAAADENALTELTEGTIDPTDPTVNFAAAPLQAPLTQTARAETLLAARQKEGASTLAASLQRKDTAETLAAAADRAAAAEPSSGDAAPDLLATLGAERMPVFEGAPAPAQAPPLETLASGAFAARLTQAQSHVAESAAAPATARIDTPIGENGWKEAFQQKIVWLVDRQQQSAELHVNPPHLGPVEVSLSVSEEGTHIAFSSPHAAVREAIESSLADLKSALSERGLSLGQATVGADSQAAREQLHGEAGRTAGHAGRRGAAEAPADAPAPVRLVQRGLVDVFA